MAIYSSQMRINTGKMGRLIPKKGRERPVLETSTVAPEQLSSQVRKVVHWYTGGFLTEEEFLHLLEQSIHSSTEQVDSGTHDSPWELVRS